jgi:hypothetical protein
MNLELILEALRELSDAEYQTALWTGKLKGEQSSFVEAVCVLFDDAGLTRALDSGSLERSYSNALCLCARKLNTLVSLLDHSESPEQTLNHPKMNNLREAARELSNLFLAESSSTPDSERSPTPRG